MIWIILGITAFIVIVLIIWCNLRNAEDVDPEDRNFK